MEFTATMSQMAIHISSVVSAAHPMAHSVKEDNFLPIYADDATRNAEFDTAQPSRK
jgi:hypothetical protein